MHYIDYETRYPRRIMGRGRVVRLVGIETLESELTRELGVHWNTVKDANELSHAIK